MREILRNEYNGNKDFCQYYYISSFVNLKVKRRKGEYVNSPIISLNKIDGRRMYGCWCTLYFNRTFAASKREEL